MPKIVSYADWESGKVKLIDEYFEPVLGRVIGCRDKNGKIEEIRDVIGYQGRKTGTRLGLWFHEVMEGSDPCQS